MSGAEMYLRDVIDIPDSVHAGDFKIDLTKGFVETDARVAEYVVTDQLQQAFGKALSIVRAAVRDGASHAAYLHGSFGSGKSHFLTVLHAVLNNDPVARAKAGLQPVIAEHDEWLRGKKFLMVPYHLVGATDIDSAILGGYVSTVRRLHPKKGTPAVYRADAMLHNARGQREFLGDDARFAEWLGSEAPATADDVLDDVDDLDVIEGTTVRTWTSAKLDHAFSAPAGDPVREALVSALLSGPMSAYSRGATGDAEAFLPLEDGLSVISRHARGLGYDGLVLFLDELILWLQAHMADQEFVNTQVSKLVKLIESGNADRALPIVSFISRQRDLSKLVGEDVTGADVKNLEAQVQYLAERFDIVSLEDRNLPAIIKERVLKPKTPQAKTALEGAFTAIESTNSAVRDVLLDANGATGADWTDFRAVYPLSPVLLNVLVALSGALQRERTGLKLLQEMLYRRRADMRLGELIPLGDLWDVLADGIGEAFTERLRQESAAAHRFHAKVRAYLLEKYGSETDMRFVADDRFVKTLMLAALAPDVSALARLTGARLAALNHGSIRSRTVAPGTMVVTRLRELAAEFGELRSEGDEDPVFRLQLSDLDIEPLLDAVGEQDSIGARRIWTKRQLWRKLGIRDVEEFVCDREVVWKGTRRTAEFVFANIRDSQDLPDVQFSPSVPGRIRIILDYPFDQHGHPPSDDVARVNRLRREGFAAATITWIPHFLSAQKSNQLGRLLKIHYLLERNRLDDYAGEMSADNRVKIRHQLQAQADTLESQLTASLMQVYGIARAEESTLGAQVGEEGHVLSLWPGHTPRLAAGAGFEQNGLTLADGLFSALYPKHPDFDTTGNRKPITVGELKTVLGWITQAMEEGKRRIVVDRSELALVRRIVHPLELGEVSDGPLNVSAEWRRRIDQAAGQRGVDGDYSVENIRSWIEELGYTGLDKVVANLIIATYALLSDRAWVLHGSPLREAPELDKIGPGHALRAQELPSADEFATARARASALLGVNVPEHLVARNVTRLASDVREKVTSLETAVNNLRRALETRADQLGVPATAARITIARYAANLLARLSATRDAMAIVRELAGAGHDDVNDQVLGNAIATAPQVLDALDRVDWNLVESVRRFVEREDAVGVQARRLLDDISDTAASDEFTHSLAPVLGDIRRRAIALIEEAARLAAVTAPLPVPTPSPKQPSFPQDAPSSHPTEHPESAGGRAKPAARRITASVVEQQLQAILDDFSTEIRDYAKDHPGVDIVLEWRIAGED
ncbi:PglY protein [Amycolatopsis albispora]|uniref:PglY protein n=1 Tax=Amycolatopsis albispora TaxID=1804986 RepID=A0A344L3S1_9PSEU|nr:PglY protein [Amycolatopsis albispora]AXB42695.1 PglY protein [Amycolatopsis albispora]